MKKYWIYRVGNGPDPLGDAKEFEPFEPEHKCWSDFSDAMYDWLHSCDCNSVFVDGYPQGEEYGVVNVDTGEEKRYRVETEFEPSFVVYEI